ncbi:MAG: TetR/AcrR family transcriptional regulator [Actinomycetota bacterium]
MNEPTPFDEPAQPTARGDRDGRRRDVLAAATSILDEAGWDGLSIRAVASRAGVSTGAVYQWFSGKDEIFGELFDREVRAGLDLIDTIPVGDLPSTIRMMMDWVVDLYDRLVRYELEFAEASSGREGREVAPAMAATYLQLGKKADEVLSRAAAHDGVTLVESEHRITWFWAGCIGTAERLTVSRQLYPPDRREELLDFAAASLVRSLIER